MSKTMFPQSGLLALILAMVFTPLATDASPSSSDSPYVKHQNRHVKALSDQEVAGYLAGEGMGMALAAELNRYPGPKHVLEMADDLALSPQQLDDTQKIFERMRTKAQSVGQMLVANERELDHLFSTQAITGKTLKRLTEQIGSLRGQLRYVHLQAHLAMREILTAEQQQIYQQRRGYSGQSHTPAHHPSAHGAHRH